MRRLNSVTLWISLLFLLPGSAMATRELNVDICVEFALDFVDAEAGDWWTDNTPVPARGVEVVVEDDSTSRTFNLGRQDGCLNVDVVVTPPSNNFVLRAKSKARVNQIDIASHDSSTWEFKPLSFKTWTLSANQTAQLLLPAEQVWMALAIGTWVFHRNDFNLLQGGTRGCCLEASSHYSLDGTCTASDPANEYSPIAPPVRFFTGSSACGSSTMQDSSGADHPAVNVSCARKWILAHELGHVIVGMRMGGREPGQERPMTAPTNRCSADYHRDDFENGILTLVDPGGMTDVRGHFTKEYMSNAFREGWATFFAIWTWNKRSESDCVKQELGYSDFDLDGTIDNDYDVLSGWIDRTHSCAGSPFFGGRFAQDSGVTDGLNWLDDMQQDSSNRCNRTATSEGEANRSTVHDVARMFWDLTVTTGSYALEPEVLADLYIDMCPLGWAAKDDEQQGYPDWDAAEGDLPYERLMLSARHHRIFRDVHQAAGDHVEH